MRFNLEMPKVRFDVSDEIKSIAKKIIKTKKLDAGYFSENDVFFLSMVIEWLNVGRFIKSKETMALMKGTGSMEALFQDCIEKFKRLGLVSVDPASLRVKEKRDLFKKAEYIIEDAFYSLIGKDKPRGKEDILRKYNQEGKYKVVPISPEEYRRRLPERYVTTKMIAPDLIIKNKILNKA